MTKSLHPTLKACHCGFIGSRKAFYDHMNATVKEYTAARLFFLEHGEAVLNSDDPRLPKEVPQPPTRRELIESL
jgi:hypothetical protein